MAEYAGLWQEWNGFLEFLPDFLVYLILCVLAMNNNNIATSFIVIDILQDIIETVRTVNKSDVFSFGNITKNNVYYFVKEWTFFCLFFQ